jgi:hypothetical protein
MTPDVPVLTTTALQISSVMDSQKFYEQPILELSDLLSNDYSDIVIQDSQARR